MPLEIANAHMEHPEGSKGTPTKETRRLFTSIRKKEDISWNLLASHTRLRNWREPAHV